MILKPSVHGLATVAQLCTWLAWLGLMALALAIAAYSVWLSWTAANQWFGADPTNLEMRPLGFAGVDLAKVFLMTVIATLVRRRRHFLATTLSVVLAVATLASVQASYTVFATGRINVLGQRQATIERRRGLREKLSGLRDELAPNDGLPPPAAIRARMRALEFDQRWQTSKGCTDATVSSSRRFCAEHAKLFARLAGSNRAAELRRKIIETRQEIRDLTTGETLTGMAPELATIARHVGLTSRGIVELRAFAIAVLIEVLSVTLVSAAWRVRPWLPDQRGPGPNVGSARQPPASKTATSAAQPVAAINRIGKNPRPKGKATDRRRSDELASTVRSPKTKKAPARTTKSARERPTEHAHSNRRDNRVAERLKRRVAEGHEGRTSVPAAAEKVPETENIEHFVLDDLTVQQFPMTAFAKACLEHAPTSIRTAAADVHARYETWCSAAGIEPVSTTKLGRELKALGFNDKRRSGPNGRYEYWGLKLRSPSPHSLL